ncbi:MAG: hypothetical protein ACE5PT_14880, partial [Gemmatimonadales bacterium]
TYESLYLADRASATAGYERAELQTSLRTVIVEMDRVLVALRDGDPERGVPVPRDAGIRTDVNERLQEWNTQLKPLLLEVGFSSGGVPAETMEALTQRASGFAQGLDEMVGRYQSIAERKVRRFAALQLGFVSLILLAGVASVA